MYEQGYSKYIRECVEQMENNRPIFTEAVAQRVVSHFGLELPYAKRIVNQNMKRLADDEVIVHFAKGIYYRPIKTPFGKSLLNKEDVYFTALTVGSDGVIGYEGCPSVLNTLGLCTQLTAEKNIVTNKYRKLIPQGVKIRASKPICNINSDNYRYLQAIDIICGMFEYPIDAENADKIIADFFELNKVEPLKVIAYAKKYDTDKALARIIEFYTEGLV